MAKILPKHICVIGSGAGAGPIILRLSQAGHKVTVLEKGPWIKTEEFTKDEMTACRKDSYSPKLKNEFHILRSKNNQGVWKEKSTKSSGRSYWNGTVVGGATNFMSAYFHRLKPNDFKLLSTYGTIDGANIVDWPISYEDMEPFYAEVENEVGISGKVINHKHQEPRSTKDFPFPPLGENIVARWLDDASKKMESELIPIPRGILSKPKKKRKACFYSGYCGSYGCASDAKGRSRAAILHPALETGNCTIIPNAKVFHLESDADKKITKAHYYLDDQKKIIEADEFVVACNAIETSRLLLQSTSEAYPNCIGNEYKQVGKNIISTGGGIGGGNLFFKNYTEDEVLELRQQGNFINRASQEHYQYQDDGAVRKGGTIDFIFEHSNPIPKVMNRKKHRGRLIYGSELKKDLHFYFTEQRMVKFEVFTDWLPNNDCFVELSKTEKDKWGDPVAKLSYHAHQRDAEVSAFLGEKGKAFLEQLGAKNIYYNTSYAPSPNLVAGGCRFGEDPKTSVLDKNCKVHSCPNLHITDGSFMPTGGSVTFTWTIYANAFRVAKYLEDKFANNF
jgi:choline dehydrogenase-like flavoprotein